MKPFQVVKDFEAALCEYTGAPYAVTVTSCTAALMLAVGWHLRNKPQPPKLIESGPLRGLMVNSVENLIAQNRADSYEIPKIEIPKRTYVGVPMSIIHAGGRPTFRDEEWEGFYQLRPLPVWDSARWFTDQLYAIINQHAAGGIPLMALEKSPGTMVCTSFHWAKTLGIQQGGAILHDDPEADRWLRRARFDGRQEGVAPKDQKEWIIGHHVYMSPETAAAGLVRLAHLPRHNAPLPMDDYPDLSQLEIFR